MVTIPLNSVGFRAGAVPSKEAVTVIDEAASKTNATASATGVGLDLETVLSVLARIRLGGPEHVWMDIHVFDDEDEVIRSETLGLCHVPAADDADLYGFEGTVYRGTGASPGSVWLAPDARKVQYRLYSEVAGAVYSDGLLHQHDLPPDSDLTHSGTPPSGRQPAAAVCP
jgi:hypothetical protein